MARRSEFTDISEELTSEVVDMAREFQLDPALPFGYEKATAERIRREWPSMSREERAAVRQNMGQDHLVGTLRGGRGA